MNMWWVWYKDQPRLVFAGMITSSCSVHLDIDLKMIHLKFIENQIQFWILSFPMNFKIGNPDVSEWTCGEYEQPTIDDDDDASSCSQWIRWVGHHFATIRCRLYRDLAYDWGWIENALEGVKRIQFQWKPCKKKQIVRMCHRSVSYETKINFDDLVSAGCVHQLITFGFIEKQAKALRGDNLNVFCWFACYHIRDTYCQYDNVDTS